MKKKRPIDAGWAGRPLVNEQSTENTLPWSDSSKQQQQHAEPLPPFAQHDARELLG